jgi:hypothetical protein
VQRQAYASEIIRRLEKEAESVAEMSIAMQPVQDLTIATTYYTQIG